MNRSILALPLLSFVMVSAFACSSSSDAPGASPADGADAGSPDDGGASGAEGGAGEVAWTKCPLHSEGDGPDAECATMKVPLDRNAPDGKTIDFFVKRYAPAGGSKKQALWMLEGGPGAAGYGYERVAEQIATKFTDVEFYMPDHRGVGHSTRLGCSAEDDATPGGYQIAPDEWAACYAEVKAQWGADLAQFGTSNAANDVALGIARTRRDGQSVFVYGASYGTYWAHRLMQIAPNTADGFVLDSIAPPGASLARQDQDADEAGKDFFAVCAADATCKSKLGDDPWSVAQGLVAKLKTGHCPDLHVPPGFEPHVFFRYLLGSSLMDPGARPLLPSIVYRANRCAANDVTALNHLLDQPGQDLPELFTRLWGWVLSNNITFSELWESPSPTTQDLAAWREALTASREVTSGMDAPLPIWEPYHDDLATSFATTDVPLLMLQGKLDPATLYRKALPMKDHFTGASQHWVEVPTATHGVITSSTTNEHRSCGTRIIMNFLADPKGPLDTSCLATVVPISFDFDAATVNAVYGTSDLWE